MPAVETPQVDIPAALADLDRATRESLEAIRMPENISTSDSGAGAEAMVDEGGASSAAADPAPPVAPTEPKRASRRRNNPTT